MLSLSIGYMKILFPKLLVTPFLALGQYPHYKLGGGGVLKYFFEGVFKKGTGTRRVGTTKLERI
jgi:hypothetical protein